MSLIKKIVIVIIVSLVCSCAIHQIKNPPDMIIEYGYGLDTPGLDTFIATVKPGARSWSYSTLFGPTHMMTDAMHPLDSSYPMPKIGKTNRVKMSISYPPDYYTVVYWPEELIGHPETIFDPQRTDVIDNMIVLPNGESGYVFLVRAVWESVNGINGTEGYADYVFFASKNGD